MIEHFLVDLPAPVLVGIGQGGPPRAFKETQVVQFSHATGPTAANLPQGLSFAELAEEHTDQLIPTGEAFSEAVSAMFANDTAKGISISKVYDLSKKVCIFKWHVPLRFVGLS